MPETYDCFEIVYYATRSRDGSYHVVVDVLSPYTMLGDNLLFDSPEECIDYWAREGITVHH